MLEQRYRDKPIEQREVGQRVVCRWWTSFDDSDILKCPASMNLHEYNYDAMINFKQKVWNKLAIHRRTWWQHASFLRCDDLKQWLQQL